MATRDMKWSHSTTVESQWQWKATHYKPDANGARAVWVAGREDVGREPAIDEL